MRNCSKQGDIYGWISHYAFIQRVQRQELIVVLSL